MKKGCTENINTRLRDLNHMFVGSAISVMKFLTIVLTLVVLILSSCAYNGEISGALPPDYKGPVYMEISPNVVSVCNGSTETVYITVLDKNRKPVPDQTVQAAVVADEGNSPTAYLFNDKAVTDETGRSEFLVTGLMYPGWSSLVFTVGDISYALDLWDSCWRSLSGSYYHDIKQFKK